MADPVIRIDRATTRIVLTDAEPSADIAPARKTAEGYLIVDAFLARDGDLVYSDGDETWIEARPREELAKAAASWTHTPVTDDHPAAMVTAETWTDTARGLVITQPTMTPVQVNGVSYLHARLLVADADLISRIENGDQAEVSIGFTTVVRDRVQTDLVGNHVAIVAEGRAGPVVRVLLDSAAWTVYDRSAMDPNSKKDEMGAPTDLVEIAGPDGAMVQVPTWVAAMLEELQALKAQQAQPEPQPQPPAPAPAPAAEAAAAPAPTAAPAPPKDEEDGKDASDDEEEDGKDAIDALVRRRARLVRLASTAGVAEEKIDGLGQDDLARAYITAKVPEAKTDGMSSDQLAAMVDVVAAMPAPEPAEPSNPWQAPRSRATSDAADNRAAKFLERQGYQLQ